MFVFVCSPSDSPFSYGQGNDYLFVGNMVYTVSILLVFSIYLCLHSLFSFLCLLPCIFVLFFLYIHSVCVYTSTVLLPQCCYESPVNLVSSSQSVSSPHLSISSLCSLLHLTLSLSFYSLQSHVNVRGVYLLRYVSVGVLSILTDIAEFTV